jgi:hypothetical protein
LLKGPASIRLSFLRGSLTFNPSKGMIDIVETKEKIK